MAETFDYLAEVEGHWTYFAEAGWLKSLFLFPFVPATDTISGSGFAVTGLPRVSEKREAGDGFLETHRRWHLRASQLTGPPTIRSELWVLDGSGDRWRIESVDVTTLGTRYVCECVKVVL